jgi:hypothetical protein
MCLSTGSFRILKKSFKYIYNSMDKVNALVFEGGATWGIAYIGAPLNYSKGSREKT